MNSTLSKFIALLVSVLLLTYVIYQTFTTLYNPYKTEIVNVGDYTSDIDLNGFFVRNEEAISTQKNGVISYNYKNSEKIPKDSTIASVYQNEDDLYNLKTVESLKSKKLILNQAQDKDAIKGLKLDLLNKQISESKAELRKLVDDNNLADIDNVFYDLMLNINKMGVSVDNINYDKTIESIDAKILDLQSMVPEQSAVITSDKSGYFSNTVDGYESKFTFDMLSNLSVDSVVNYIDKPISGEFNNIGKIMYDNFWYFVSKVSLKDAEILNKLYEKNQSVNLKFNSKSTREVKATIQDVITKKDSDVAVAVFKSLYIDEDIINMRFETPKAVINSYSGIIIPKEAIRLRDGTIDKETGLPSGKEKGVYTLLGKTVRFRKVDCIYEDEYILISRQSNKSNYVSVYDQVIIKGKNLNDNS